MTPADEPKPDASPDTRNDEDPGVPGFRSWRAVYAFVFGFFVFVVIALTIFTHVYG